MLLLVRVVVSVERRGSWKGCVETRFWFRGSRFVTEQTPAALMVLLWASGGRTLGRCPVSTDPLALGVLTSKIPRLFVVVTITVCCVSDRFTMLVKLGIRVYVLVGLKGIIVVGVSGETLCRVLIILCVARVGQMVTSLV